MKQYGVFENDKPCSPAGFDWCTLPCWSNHLFPSFEEAHDYAISWLGHHADSFLHLKLNEPYDYGYGDVITIKEVNE
jgi:hypothetical protein